MSEFFAVIKVLVICGTLFFVTMLVLLALPKCRLRSLGLECMKYALAAGLFLMAPSPIDVVPDVIPVLGWADDIGYLVGGVAAIRSGLKERRQRAFEQECENARLARMSYGEPTKSGDVPACNDFDSQAAN